MRIAKEKLAKNLEEQIHTVLYQLMADIRDPEEVRSFFQAFFNQAARLSLAKKLAIVLFLDKKRSYQNIKETLKVSSSTVAEMDKKIGHPGSQLALRKIKTEEWAEKWSQKIGRVLGKILPDQ